MSLNERVELTDPILIVAEQARQLAEEGPTELMVEKLRLEEIRALLGEQDAIYLERLTAAGMKGDMELAPFSNIKDRIERAEKTRKNAEMRVTRLVEGSEVIRRLRGRIEMVVWGGTLVDEDMGDVDMGFMCNNEQIDEILSSLTDLEVVIEGRDNNSVTIRVGDIKYDILLVPIVVADLQKVAKVCEVDLGNLSDLEISLK